MKWLGHKFFPPSKSNVYRPSKQLFVRIAVQIFNIFNQSEEEILQESLAKLYGFKVCWNEGIFIRWLYVCAPCVKTKYHFFLKYKLKAKFYYLCSEKSLKIMTQRQFPRFENHPKVMLMLGEVRWMV